MSAFVTKRYNNRESVVVAKDLMVLVVVHVVRFMLCVPSSRLQTQETGLTLPPATAWSFDNRLTLSQSVKKSIKRTSNQQSPDVFLRWKYNV